MGSSIVSSEHSFYPLGAVVNLRGCHAMQINVLTVFVDTHAVLLGEF